MVVGAEGSQLAVQRRRFGWRRLKILLDREGMRMNHKKLSRLYRDEKRQTSPT
jgi:putative transposase